ncbi:hypothetical protein [Anaerobacillus alkaliphilus]|uniref:hypothetical protein n=1 Tax=Anaerobacillus alkaliphilus TaxID=1548597 RepID=UPI001F4FC174|nr:hypothetical protein [Anaerobacillus alkaliphilus]
MSTKIKLLSKEKLADYFRPEFLNRFDAIIEFNHLDKDELVKIVDIMLGDLVEKLGEQGITMTVTEEVNVKLTELGVNPAFGARPLRRVIQDQIEDH